MKPETHSDARTLVYRFTNWLGLAV